MKFTDETKIIEESHERPSFLVCIPTLGTVDIRFLLGFSRLQMPVNCNSRSLIISKCEVGVARNHAGKCLLEMNPMPKYLFFFGDDMIPSWDGLVHLWQEMETGKWDVLSGLYYIKQKDMPVPVAWRDNVAGWLVPGVHYPHGEATWMDVVGMDFTLIKREVFETLKYPWFETGPGHLPGESFSSEAGQDIPDYFTVYTEDVYFTRLCKMAGLTVGVHSGVRVGHLDVKTGEIY